jgi:hypothetical protein
MGVFVLRARDDEVWGERGSCFVIVTSEGKQMNSVEDLDVVKLAHQLALKTYSATKVFPKEELFSLGDQTRRAATVRPSFRRFENSRNVEVPRYS